MGFDSRSPEAEDEDISKTKSFILALMSVLILLCAVGCVITSAVLKNENSDIPDNMFIIWASIPAIMVGFVGISAAIFKKKRIISVFLVLALFTMVLCGVAAVLNGLARYSDGWKYIAKEADSCKSTTTNGCSCVDPPYPFKTTKCEDLGKIDNLLVAQSSLAALTTIILLISCFQATTVLCCGPWVFIDYSDRLHHHSPPHAPPKYYSQHRYSYGH